jgi:hypothetical protein
MPSKVESEKQFQEWVDSVHWKFAKTYAKHAPHEYTVTEWKPELGKTFTVLAHFICEHGQIDLYHGHPFTVYYLNGWKYWICDKNPDDATLINRTCEEWSVKFGLTWNPPAGFKAATNVGRPLETAPADGPSKEEKPRVDAPVAENPRKTIYIFDDEAPKRGHPYGYVTEDLADGFMCPFPRQTLVRSDEDKYPSLTMDEMRAFIAGHSWKFATTFAKTAPHWYTLEKNCRSRVEFYRAVATIRRVGYGMHYHSGAMIYLDVDNWYYWTCGYPVEDTELINRADIKFKGTYGGLL